MLKMLDRGTRIIHERSIYSTSVLQGPLRRIHFNQIRDKSQKAKV